MINEIQTLLIDGIMQIRINRPAKKNALTVAMYEALVDSLILAEQDPEVKVILFTGTEGAFTAGNDLQDFLKSPPKDDSAPVIRFINLLPKAKKPMIAAVNGMAVGIGTTMLLHCDLVYASRSAMFVLPFINLALVPEAASSLLLPRIAGYHKAAELLMLGEPFDPQVALEARIINAICADDQLLDTAMEAAKKLTEKPQAALLATKALLKQEDVFVSSRIESELSEFIKHLSSAESKEAFTAFLEKRKPDFSKFD